MYHWYHMTRQMTLATMIAVTLGLGACSNEPTTQGRKDINARAKQIVNTLEKATSGFIQDAEAGRLDQYQPWQREKFVAVSQEIEAYRDMLDNTATDMQRLIGLESRATVNLALAHMSFQDAKNAWNEIATELTRLSVRSTDAQVIAIEAEAMSRTSFDQQVTELRQEIQDLQSQLDAQRNTIENLQQQIEDKRAQAEQLRNQRNELLAQADELLDQAFSDQTQKRFALTEQAGELRMRADKMITQAEQLEAEAEQLNKQLITERSQEQELMAKLNGAEGAVNKFQQITSDLQVRSDDRLTTRDSTMRDVSGALRDIVETFDAQVAEPMQQAYQRMSVAVESRADAKVLYDETTQQAGAVMNQVAAMTSTAQLQYRRSVMLENFAQYLEQLGGDQTQFSQTAEVHAEQAQTTREASITTIDQAVGLVNEWLPRIDRETKLVANFSHLLSSLLQLKALMVDDAQQRQQLIQQAQQADQRAEDPMLDGPTIDQPATDAPAEDQAEPAAADAE